MVDTTHEKKTRYYRLELDDYSAAAFTSFGKCYYGTTEDFRCFFRELTIDVDLKKQFGFRNRLAESEKQFKTMEEVQQDWEAFLKSPDPDYSEFCNDIFGDG